MHQRDQNSTSTHQFTSSSNSSKNISFWLRWLLFLSFPVLCQRIIPWNQQARLGTKTCFIYGRGNDHSYWSLCPRRSSLPAMYPPSPPWTAHISFNMTLILLWTTQLPVARSHNSKVHHILQHIQGSFLRRRSKAVWNILMLEVFPCVKSSLIMSEPQQSFVLR